MASSWQVLAGNLAVVALVVLAWGHARFLLRAVDGVARSALFGATMGAGAIASMLMAAQIEPGLYIDLRLSLIALAGFFGGPLSAFVATALAMSWRVDMGGQGMWLGLSFIGLAALLGLGGRLILRGRSPHVVAVFGLGSAVAILASLMLLAVPREHMLTAFIAFVLPVAAVNQLATTLAGLVVLQARRISAERDLMAAALASSPDYAYVKDQQGRFAAVNKAIAAFNGFDSASDMLGKTEADIASPERAQALFEQEQRVIKTGEPLIDQQEHLPDRDGNWRWLSTSKVPLYSASGELIGLTGVMRDVTSEKQLRQELLDNRNTLSYALGEMSDGLAMFDSSKRIELCNERYRKCFPFTGNLRRPGTHMRDILKAVIATGEQVSAPAENTEDWIEKIVGNLCRDSEEEINLFDGRWLQVRTRPTREGKTVVVVTDVTRIKNAELALQSATDQLKHLVRTDALTGLLNRRAFDDAMDSEIARSSRASTPMSLLLIDVDRFKAYNDRYGHPSGDECLKLVAHHLKNSLKRASDLAVRYGGEEFAAILPHTDEDGAYLVAEAFRKALVAAGIEHSGTERGILTASVGVATYMPDNLHRSAAELIQVADDALYSAKSAGRDRVYGTRIRVKQAKYAHE